MAETLGGLVRRLRKQAGMTQFQLAELAQLGERTIGRIENDKPFDHRLGTVARLADALDAGPEDRRRLTAAVGGAEEVPAQEPPGPRSAPARAHGPLADAADELARESKRRWRREEAQHRVHHPFALPVRWRQVPAGVSDRSENTQRLAPGDTSSEVDLSGDLRRVAEVYRRIPSGRLVVLGRAGSGKSILAIRFALDLLDARARSERVPVIFSLGSWDPTAVALRDWLIARLLRDYPHLARRVPSGKSLAADLLDDDLILPVLDGFDELAEGLRGEALDALNLSPLPLVLTSRHGEFTEAVRSEHAPLASAVVLELRDLTLEDLRNYLPRTDPAFPDLPGPEEPGATWDTVLDEARLSQSAGGANLAAALSTPLMIALARTMYSDTPDRRPDELLDTTRFPDPHAIEEHLLAGFVPAVYRRRAPERLDNGRPHRAQWDPERAQRWLGYLAHHLVRLDRERQDLAWWELGTSMRRSSRTLIVGFLAGLAFGVTTAVGNLPVDLVATSHGLRFAIVRGLVVGVLHGLAAGLLFGLVYWYASEREAFKPSPVRIKLSGGTRQTRGNARARFMVGVGCGLAAMAMLVLIDEGVVAPLGLGDGQRGDRLLTGLVFIPAIALATGLVFALIAVLEAPVRTESVVSPAGLLDMDRRNVAFHLVTWALVIGLLVGLLNGIVYGPVRGLEVGTVFGLEAAFGAGLGYGLSLTAWGQWVALARIWLPLTGRLPWALIAFLDDAHQRGVLRQVGAVYQFRHARIQSHLSRAFQERHEPRRPGPSAGGDPARAT
ncbi:helix-turn-helix transcriptional regulator [Kitasatospora sp. NPDC048540]|uniref:helix-turn-helix transcriptional regulator n=1 Tax=Kitasatospora sp. NPDC048540 TaxID=3155634 RepID=UPI0033CCA933